MTEMSRPYSEAKVRTGIQSAARVRSIWKMSPAVSGGGSFFDVGGHVLDLLDYWFGPIQFTGGSAMNALPSHEVEDAVSLSFRGADGLRDSECCGRF